MATNQENAEVPAEGSVSVSQATELFAQFETEEPIDGGEGEELEALDGNDGTDDVQPADEGDEGADEEEVEAADEADGDDEGDEDFDDDDDPWVTIKVDGEEQDVRLSELRRGYQRQVDYTRKTQELANQRRKVEQGMNQVQQQALSYADAYLGVAGQFEKLAPTEEDIKDAWGFDPKRAAEMKDRREHILTLARQSKDLAVAIHRQRQAQLQQQMAEAAKTLPEHVPEWSDLDVRKQELKAVAQHLIERGLDPKDIEQTANPVAWAIARDAWLYRQLQERTAAKEGKEPAPKVRKSRAPKPRLKGSRRKVAEAKKAFNKSQGKDEAIALLAQFEE